MNLRHGPYSDEHASSTRRGRDRIRGKPTVAERLFAYVDKGDGSGCWVWFGNTKGRGYGTITISDNLVVGRKVKAAHRVSWELVNGPIPDGLHVLHHCDNPPCVRPDHLFLGTNAENTADRNAKGRQARGERMGNAKLTAPQVIEIRRRVLAGESMRRVCGDYNVNHTAISSIMRGRTWRHIA